MSMASGPTRQAYVIGQPIAHSRSPIIHRYWLQTYGIDGAYDAKEVAPGALSAFFDVVRNGAALGCNVTIPHKEAALSLVDDATPEAAALGAVNTVWRQGRKLIATSTDGAGFLAHLDQSVPDWRGRPGYVLILGAGGAARAIADSLLRDGDHDVVVANRTEARAEAVVGMLNKSHARPARARHGAWETRDRLVADAGLIINTTALGMAGQPPLDLDLGAARATTAVADIVYAPLETNLLKSARVCGLDAIDGLGMLLHQAVPGFAAWFGVRPEVTPELRARVVADLTRGA